MIKESLADYITRLEQERDELLEEIKQLHNGRSTEELYTLFGKPIKYWEELEQENKSNKELLIIAQNEAMEAQADREKYKDALEEIRKYIGTCCHRFSSNHEALCFGCEYDREVCDYSIVLDKIEGVLK